MSDDNRIHTYHQRFDQKLKRDPDAVEREVTAAVASLCDRFEDALKVDGLDPRGARAQLGMIAFGIAINPLITPKDARDRTTSLASVARILGFDRAEPKLKASKTIEERLRELRARVAEAGDDDMLDGEVVDAEP